MSWNMEAGRSAPPLQQLPVLYPPPPVLLPPPMATVNYSDLPLGGKGLKGRSVRALASKAAVEAFFHYGGVSEGSCADGHNPIRGYEIRNGYLLAREGCVRCARRWDIRKHDVAPIWDACFTSPDEATPDVCDRCGKRCRTEHHHWAPQALFDDANQWPKSYLCAECHDRWHATINRAAT